jgi:thiol-disulfide isomerase/thioredoxin
MNAKKVIAIVFGVLFACFIAFITLVYVLLNYIENTRSHAPDPKVIASSMQVIADLKLTDLDGKTAQLPGKGRYRIVNYWASWCGPCIEELPLFNHYAADAKVSTPMIIGIGLEEETVISSYLSDNPSKYANFVEYTDDDDSSHALGNSSGTIPYTILISPEGKLLKQRNGAFSSVEELKSFAQPPK